MEVLLGDTMQCCCFVNIAGVVVAVKCSPTGAWNRVFELLSVFFVLLRIYIVVRDNVRLRYLRQMIDHIGGPDGKQQPQPPQ